MEITPARAQDIDAILDLWGEPAPFHADLDPAFTPAAGWRAAYAGYLATLLGRPDARVLVARQEGRIVGYGVARITFLPPFFAQRRRGVGGGPAGPAGSIRSLPPPPPRPAANAVPVHNCTFQAIPSSGCGRTTRVKVPQDGLMFAIRVRATK